MANPRIFIIKAIKFIKIQIPIFLNMFASTVINEKFPFEYY